MQLSLEQGRYLVGLARKAIKEYLEILPSMISNLSAQQCIVDKGKSEKELFPELSTPKGVFCTLNKYPSKELCGCIGLPYPDKPLKEAVLLVSIDSAQDPRFPPLTREELATVTIELSILAKPELIVVQKPEEYLEKIEEGNDGLILRYKEASSGTLISQAVFLRQVWGKLPTKEMFLSQLCYKANLWSPNAWRYPDVELLKFRAQIFEEKEPEGEIKEKLL